MKKRNKEPLFFSKKRHWSLFGMEINVSTSQCLSTGHFKPLRRMLRPLSILACRARISFASARLAAKYICRIWFGLVTGKRLITDIILSKKFVACLLSSFHWLHHFEKHCHRVFCSENLKCVYWSLKRANWTLYFWWLLWWEQFLERAVMQQSAKVPPNPTQPLQFCSASL